MLKSIRAKILLAILTVTMFTACSLTVVFYFRAAGMIEENYSGILYGRMQQTIKNLDEIPERDLLCEYENCLGYRYTE